MTVQYIEKIDTEIDPERGKIRIGGGRIEGISELEALVILARYSTDDNTVQDSLGYLERCSRSINQNQLTVSEHNIRERFTAIMPKRRG